MGVGKYNEFDTNTPSCMRNDVYHLITSIDVLLIYVWYTSEQIEAENNLSEILK